MSDTHEILSTESEISSDEYSSEEENDSQLIQSVINSKINEVANDSESSQSSSGVEIKTPSASWLKKKAQIQRNCKRSNKTLGIVLLAKRKAVNFLRLRDLSSKKLQKDSARRLSQSEQLLQPSTHLSSACNISNVPQIEPTGPISLSVNNALETAKHEMPQANFRNGSLWNRGWQQGDVLCTPENKTQRMSYVHRDSPWPAECLNKQDTNALRDRQQVVIDNKRPPTRTCELVLLSDSEDEGTVDVILRNETANISVNAINAKIEHSVAANIQMNGVLLNQTKSLRNQQETNQLAPKAITTQIDSLDNNKPLLPKDSMETDCSSTNVDVVPAKEALNAKQFKNLIEESYAKLTPSSKQQNYETANAIHSDNSKPTFKRPRSSTESPNANESDIPEAKRPTVNAFWQNVMSIYPLYRNTINDAVSNAQSYEDFLEVRISCLEKAVKSSEEKIEATLQEYSRLNFFNNIMVETLGRLKLQLESVKSREIFKTCSLSQLDELNKLIQNDNVKDGKLLREELLQKIAEQQPLTKEQSSEDRPITVKDLQNFLEGYHKLQKQSSSTGSGSINFPNTTTNRCRIQNEDSVVIANENLFGLSSIDRLPNLDKPNIEERSILNECLQKIQRMGSFEINQQNEPRRDLLHRSKSQMSTAAHTNYEKHSATSILSQLVNKLEQSIKQDVKVSHSLSFLNKTPPRQQTHLVNGTESNENNKNCHKCSKPNALIVCNDCHKVSYCSEHCQVIDWLAHNGNCQSESHRLPARTASAGSVNLPFKSWY